MTDQTEQKQEEQAPAVDICDLLRKPDKPHRKRMSIRRLTHYMRSKNRKTMESAYFRWKSLNPNVYDKKDGKKIAGAIDFYGCRLLATLDEQDPAMAKGKKVCMVRWLPSTMTYIFFVKPDPKSARVFTADVTKLTKAE